ncbi:hypothetical protein [Nostoc sp.]|uniref:hypothetical protein n=1 Tax=Nostoc sp. TaxID=1180 RepID=UPI002FF96D70
MASGLVIRNRGYAFISTDGQSGIQKVGLPEVDEKSSRLSEAKPRKGKIKLTRMVYSVLSAEYNLFTQNSELFCSILLYHRLRYFGCGSIKGLVPR